MDLRLLYVFLNIFECSSFIRINSKIPIVSRKSMKKSKNNDVNPDSSDFYWSLSDLYKNIEKRDLFEASLSEDGTSVNVIDKNKYSHMVDILPSDTETIENLLRKKNINFSVSKKKVGIINSVLNIIFPISIILYIYTLISSMRNNGFSNAMFNTRIGLIEEYNSEYFTTFSDIAGCDESKLELKEIVEFLKNPNKFNEVGAICPKGVLLEGPPGTGKTLLARAVAGEAEVPFISTSGSDFVEIFVGMGASRVRKLFEDAKKKSPCIIFIDEIDSIGRSRARGNIGNNDEREQTLNQILSEMDGFNTNNGIIVLAATNRADILDSALLRPGRFDRRVPVNLPDKNGRYQILKIHSKNKPFNHDVNLQNIAANTIGFSGASLQNLLNEAAIITARNGKTVIGNEEIEYAIDRITVGQVKPLGPNVRKDIIAYHEAGHALIAELIPNYDKVSKITIIPRSNGAGGFTMFIPSEERLETGLYSQKYFKNQLMVALGGRVAEEIQFGEDEITSGASSDLQRVRILARKMITQLGFSTKIHDISIPIAWESNDPSETMYNSRMSVNLENKIDEEITKLVQEAYNKCKELLISNKDVLDLISNELIINETITGDQFKELLKTISLNKIKI